MEGLISTHSAPTLRQGPLSPAGLTLERNILQQMSQELEVVESGLGFSSLAWRACLAAPSPQLDPQRCTDWVWGHTPVISALPWERGS